MTKNFFAKAISIMLALFLTFGGTMTAFAAGTENGIMPCDGVETLPYGVWYSLSGFTLHDTNTTPLKTAPSNAGTHRGQIYVKFSWYQGDPNSSPITLTVKIKRANGTFETIGQADAAGMHYYYLQSNWFSVSPGEKFQIFFDVSTATGGTSTGSYRYAAIESWEIYID